MSIAPATSRSAASFTLLSSTLMLVFSLFLVIPFNLYLGNIEEFEAGFLQLLQSYWYWGAIAWLVLMLPVILNVRFIRTYSALIFMLACYTWLQSEVLIWDYGVRDGRGMDFQPFTAYGVLDLCVLAGFLVAAVKYSHTIAKAINTIAWIFILGQSLVLWSNSTEHEESLVRTFPSTELPAAFSKLSQQSNIFHIILDSAQSDVFIELIDEANLRSAFDGFTLFLDNAAVAPHTVFGIPSTFSGNLYDGKQSPQDFFRSAIKKGFHKELLDSGYTVNLIPALSMEKGAFTNHYPIPVNYRGTPADLISENRNRLLDTAMFRTAPHFLRIRIYNAGNWLLSSVKTTRNNTRSFREKRFFQDYTGQLDVSQEEPAYHFVHLMPPHPPYVTLADGSYAGKVFPNNRENYKNEARPLLALLTDFISKLKSLDVYHNSTIIIQGDHGSSVPAVIDGTTIKPCLLRLPALLMVKPVAANGILDVSQAPTSLLDVAPTVRKIIGKDATGVFDLDPNESRERHFFSHKSNTIKRYLVDGSVFAVDSCKAIGTTTVTTTKRIYALNTVIDFGILGNSHGIAGQGWVAPADNISWSRSKQAYLNINLKPGDTGKDLNMTLTFRPYLHAKKHPTQRIKLFVGDTLVEEWVESDRKMHSKQVLISGSLVTSNELQILFEFPDAASPYSLGVGGARQKFGIALQSLKLQAKTN